MFSTMKSKGLVIKRFRITNIVVLGNLINFNIIPIPHHYGSHMHRL